MRGLGAALQVSGSLVTRLTNLAVALRWPTNTANYLRFFGRAPNYVVPATMSEKLQWRKIFDRNPLHAVCADKVAARELVAELAPQVRFPVLLWVGDDPEQIPFERFDRPQG